MSGDFPLIYPNMRTLKSVLTAAVIAAMSLAPASKAAPTGDQAAATADDLAPQLIGTWVFEENVEHASQVAPGIGRLQFFTGRHWVMTHPNPRTHEVIFHHGGTYVLKGNELIKTVDYAMDSTRGYIGTTRRFRITIQGDTLIQVAMDGNPFTEVWHRAK
jgi:hypothetical protein